MTVRDLVAHAPAFQPPAGTDAFRIFITDLIWHRQPPLMQLWAEMPKFALLGERWPVPVAEEVGSGRSPLGYYSFYQANFRAHCEPASSTTAGSRCSSFGPQQELGSGATVHFGPFKDGLSGSSLRYKLEWLTLKDILSTDITV